MGSFQLLIVVSRLGAAKCAMPRPSRDSVTVIVPASTSNLGSGFDTLGLALNLSNRITINRGERAGVTVDAELPRQTLEGAQSMVERAARALFIAASVPPMPIHVSIRGNVPVARGVGYSATVRLGVIAGLNLLLDAGLSKHQLLGVGTQLEGHPDNISPALFGGFTVSGTVQNAVRCLRFPVSPDLKIIALFPRMTLGTTKARGVLPKTYSRRDTCHALNRSALITAAFAKQDYAALRGLFDDVVHQPYREKLVPFLIPVIRAAEQAGAIGGFLSGAGSGVICLALANAKKVAAAMQSVLRESEVQILRVDNDGLRPLV